MSKNNTSQKWSCSLCTYSNYDSAKRCTMCRSPRYAVFIPGSPCNSEVIYNCDQNIIKRWPCPDCTYMNVIKARRCSLCYRLRPAVYAEEGILIENSDNPVDSNETKSLSNALNKWECAQCTYKNWPLVKQCTMCSAPKGFPALCNSDYPQGLLIYLTPVFSALLN
ncbi:hypothetical protein AB6A40_009740 [Gnathostoma spinigerum]|uniref:RanBP2-type domain-containing protein n=1 Tax=Gnathostoma spinigerum TaxID=75299 RepID=A0ABD6ET50_9BILA